jgi:deazaflavin-dependent oxidoreductase (nitroreductase family)
MSVPTFKDIPTDINALIRAHIAQYMTDPAAAHMWDARPVGLPGEVTTLLLTTIGRKSGEERHVPLLYVDYGDAYLIMGSKGGNVDHPVWYLNLQANPECEIRVSTLRTRARARTLEGAERAEAWAKVAERHPTYAKYQARTEREIPVVLLEPIAG